MKLLDLFSGIGGFSLGLERAGMRTVAFCEVDPYCRAVLVKHWPGIPCYGDIRDLTATRLVADGIDVEAICGGFPCQDLSFAGKGVGLTGARSGLWCEYFRLIREIRPQLVLVENVAALLTRGLGTILGELASIGYDAEWHCIPASYVGAPHRRDRLWIIAYPHGGGFEKQSERHGGKEVWIDSSCRYNAERLCDPLADAASDGLQGSRSAASPPDVRRRSSYPGQALADAERERLERISKGRPETRPIDRSSNGGNSGGWSIEPDVGRVAHGIPSRVDRLRSLGNAVVPQVPEAIGRAIMRLQHEGFQT